MLKLLLVSQDKESLSGLLSVLKGYDDINVVTSESGEKTLTMVRDNPVDLVVADEDLGDMTGLEMAEKILKINPMINFAVISDLSPDDFHEASEGLGIMLQLPRHPGAKDAEEMVTILKQIKGMLV